MKKVLILKIFVAVVIALSVITATILLLVPRREIYNHLYETYNLETQTGMSAFEAELNYDGMIQQITGKQKITGLSTYDSRDDLVDKILRMQRIYRSCKWICGMGILVAVAGLIVLRNQKWYECLRIGGMITIGLDGLMGLVILIIRPLRLFVLKSQYGEFLGYDPQLVKILPENWAFYTTCAGLGAILLVGIILMLLHVGSRKSYKPHKF